MDTDKLQEHLLQMASFAKDVEYIKKDIGEIKTMLVSNFVTKDQFDPVKRIVYGLVASILLAVVGGVLTLVLISP